MLSTVVLLMCLNATPAAAGAELAAPQDAAAPAGQEGSAAPETEAPPEEAGETAAAPSDVDEAERADEESVDAGSAAAESVDEAESDDADAVDESTEDESAIEDEDAEDKSTLRTVTSQIAFAWLFTSAACAILPFVNVIPLLGQMASVLVYPCGGLGALSGFVVTLTGELRSDTRGAFIWPVVCGASTQGALTSAGLVFGPMVLLVLAGGSIVGASQLPPEVANSLGTIAALLGIYGAYAVSFAVISAALVAAVALAPVAASAAYWITAEPQGENDDGSFRWPGWTAPNHPDVFTVELEVPGRPAVVTRASPASAMAF